VQPSIKKFCQAAVYIHASLCHTRGLVPLQLMLSFLQNEGVHGLASLLDNSADIRLFSITDDPVNKMSSSSKAGKSKKEF